MGRSHHHSLCPLAASAWQKHLQAAAAHHWLLTSSQWDHCACFEHLRLRCHSETKQAKQHMWACICGRCNRLARAPSGFCMHLESHLQSHTPHGCAATGVMHCALPVCGARRLLLTWAMQRLSCPCCTSNPFLPFTPPCTSRHRAWVTPRCTHPFWMPVFTGSDGFKTPRRTTQPLASC